MKNVCPAHSGFEVEIKNLVDSNGRIEKNMNIWHEHIDLRIDKLEQKISGFAVLREKARTNRLLIFASFSAIAGLTGYIIYHVGQK